MYIDNIKNNTYKKSQNIASGNGYLYLSWTESQFTLLSKKSQFVPT